MKYVTFLDKLNSDGEILKKMMETEIVRTRIAIEDQIHLDLIIDGRAKVSRRRKDGMVKYLKRIRELKTRWENVDHLGRKLYKLKSQGSILPKRPNRTISEKSFFMRKEDLDRRRVDRRLEKMGEMEDGNWDEDVIDYDLQDNPLLLWVFLELSKDDLQFECDGWKAPLLEVPLKEAVNF